MLQCVMNGIMHSSNTCSTQIRRTVVVLCAHAEVIKSYAFKIIYDARRICAGVNTRSKYVR